MEKNLIKRVLSMALAVSMLCLLLAGCGNGGEDGDGYVYVPDYLSLPEEITEMSYPTISGDTIYFTQTRYYDSNEKEISQEEYYNNSAPAATTDVVSSDSDVAYDSNAAANAAASSSQNPENGSTKTIICSVKTDGSDYTEYPDYKMPEFTDENTNGGLNSLFVDHEGNLWALEYISTTTYDLPEGVDENSEEAYEYATYDEKYNLCMLSETGEKTTEVDLNSVIDKQDEEEGFGLYIDSVVFDKDGNIYFTDGNSTVYVLDSNGKLLFKLTEENGINAVLKLKDDSIAASVFDNDYNSSLKVIDVDSKDWGKQKSIPSDAYDFSSGGTVYDFCYESGTSLFGYDCDTETETKILTWINCDIDGNNIQFSTIKENGDVLAVSNDWSQDEPIYEVITLVKTKADEVEKKTALTFATIYLDYDLRSQIIKFNKENPDYRIEIVDYSEYDTEEDYNAGTTKLNTEIISGNTPDIISIDSLPYQQYAAKGLLEDLYPYIDKDSDISREDFVQSILKATQSGDKLYTISPSFSVMSIIGASSVVGEEMGWTLSEMQNIIDQYPEADYPFGAYITRDEILNVLCMLNLDSFVDWQTGKCNFDSEDFKNLLKFSSTFPESVEYPEDGEDYLEESTLVPDGRQLLSFYSSSEFTDYQWYKAIYGGDITYKGMPTEEGVGNIASINGGIAITSSCEHKDGAWQFLKMILDEEYQNSIWEYPIIQSAFDNKLAEAMEQYEKDEDGNYILDENGEKVPASGGGMSMGDFSIEFGPVTQEEADQIIAMVNSVEHTANYDMEMMDVITEETAAYFAGEKSLDETASVIQSRMSIYINEQR